MWISARQLALRLRQPRSRAAERGDVARRLRAEAAAAGDAEERALARRLRRGRERLSRALAGVSSCAGCAGGSRLPEGAFAGGACCGTDTHRVFSDDEVAALAAAGTRPRHLALPEGVPGSLDTGCAFRGPTGCSLEPAHRPTVCVRYVCTQLSRELYAAGRLAEVETLSDELARDSEELAALREARREWPF